MYRIFHQYSYGIDLCYSLAFLTLIDHFFRTVCGDSCVGKEEGVAVYFKVCKEDRLVLSINQRSWEERKKWYG